MEKEIERAEAALEELQREMEVNASDYVKLMELEEKKTAADAALEALYAQWEELSD